MTESLFKIFYNLHVCPLWCVTDSIPTPLAYFFFITITLHLGVGGGLCVVVHGTVTPDRKKNLHLQNGSLFSAQYE